MRCRASIHFITTDFNPLKKKHNFESRRLDIYNKSKSWQIHTTKSLPNRICGQIPQCCSR